MVLEQLDCHRQKKGRKVGSRWEGGRKEERKKSKTFLHSLHKNELIIDHRLKCQAYNFKTFRREHRRKSSGPGAWWTILSLDTKNTINKRKKNNWIASKLNTLFVKDPVKRMKRHVTNWDKIFTNYTSNKKLISRIHKDLSNMNSIKRSTPIRKQSKNMEKKLGKQFHNNSSRKNKIQELTKDVTSCTIKTTKLCWKKLKT